ncbi:hypothetical protein GCM10017744_024940 [Streptomyces antimycoticus]|uniref:Uncharacterized protein n=1 Tax=Streptomyces antimycoticus TaxID=68175 RepID=A0A4D4KEU3_9ACTN|nr:hypothetical protein SANT12839_077340 [Streptomyces antimycoticus]
MRDGEVDAAAAHIQRGLEQTALLMAGDERKMGVGPRPDRPAGERRGAVLTARPPGLLRVQVEVGAEGVMHPQPLAQPGGLVHEAAALPEPVDLLQADDVHPQVLDHPGDAFQVQYVGGARAVVDVERGHAQPSRTRGGGRHPGRPGGGRGAEAGRHGEESASTGGSIQVIHGGQRAFRFRTSSHGAMNGPGRAGVVAAFHPSGNRDRSQRRSNLIG